MVGGTEKKNNIFQYAWNRDILFFRGLIDPPLGSANG